MEGETLSYRLLGVRYVDFLRSAYTDLSPSPALARTHAHTLSLSFHYISLTLTHTLTPSLSHFLELWHDLPRFRSDRARPVEDMVD